MASSNPGTPTRLLQSTIHNGQYQIVHLLGQGGFGAVYLAKDLLLGSRQVAIKEMSLQNLHSSEIVDATVAFKREALLLAGLRHTNLPRIYAHFDDSGRWYLVMDYIEGQTLEKLLQQAPNGRLSVDTVLDIGIQLCTVLDYLHTRKQPIIFRDLKPANIMREDETIHLIDFGIARHFKQGQSKDTEALGSKGYAPPEQYGKAQTTVRSDIYSLGATLHHLLSGHDPSDHPFKFASLVQSRVFPPSDPALIDLDALIQQMVAMDEDKRPGSAKDVKGELLAIQQILASPSLLTSAAQLPPLPAASSAGIVVPVSEEEREASTLPQVNIYCVYSSKNAKLLADLETNLLASTRDTFHLKITKDLPPGEKRHISLENLLQHSNITLLLVSTHFIASDECYHIAGRAVSLARQGIGCVIPIILEDCQWKTQPYGSLQNTPKEKPLSSWRPKSRGWSQIVSEVYSIIQTLHKGGKLKLVTVSTASPTPPPSRKTTIETDPQRIAELYWERP